MSIMDCGDIIHTVHAAASTWKCQSALRFITGDKYDYPHYALLYMKSQLALSCDFNPGNLHIQIIFFC